MFQLFAMTLLSIGIQYIIWYLNKDGEKQKNKPPTKDQYNFPTADQTRPLPKFWGTVKLTSPNVLAFEITKQERVVVKQKSLFGTQTTETQNFKTYINMHLGFALTDEQQGAKLKSILVNDEVVWNNGSDTFGDISSSINKDDFFGEENGLSGSFDFMSGKSGQTSNSFLVSNLYDGFGFKWRKLSHLVLKNFYIGNSSSGQGSIPPFSVILEQAPVPDWANSTYSNFDGDCNPIVVIYYMLTEYYAGGRIKENLIDLESFQQAHVKLYNEGLGISLLKQESNSVESDIFSILETIDGQMFTDLSTGKLKITLNRADYEIVDLLHLKLDKTITEQSPIKEYSSSKTTATTTVSELRVEYTDKNDNFITKYMPFRNEEARFKKEKGEVKTLNYQMITKSSIANKIATREGIPLSSSLIKLNLVTNRVLSNKVIGDVVLVTIDKLKIYSTPFRIVKINYGTLKNPDINVELIQDRFGRYESIFSDTNPNIGTTTTAEAVQSNLKIINPPAYFNKNLNIENNLILTFAQLPNNRQLYFDLYTKRGLNEYIKNGISSGFSQYANIEDNINTHDNEIVVYANNLNLNTYGIDNLNAGFNMALLLDEFNNKQEFINFESAVYNELTGNYALNNVNRGLLDTIPKKFVSTTTKIFIFSYGYAINNLEYFSNENIKVKSINKTASDVQVLSEATEYNFTVEDRHKKPINVSNLKVNGLLFEDDQLIVHDDDISFNWSYRDAKNTIQYYNEVNNINNDDVDVVINLYDISDVLLITTTLSSNETSWAWTHETGGQPHRLHYVRAEIFTKKGIVESQDKYDIIIRRED